MPIKLAFPSRRWRRASTRTHGSCLMLASGDRLADCIVTTRRAGVCLQKGPVFGLLARFSHIVMLATSRSTAEPAATENAGEKFASCLTAYQWRLEKSLRYTFT